MSRLPEIREQVSLQGLNTLAVPAQARYFADITTADELVDFLTLPGYEQLN